VRPAIGPNTPMSLTTPVAQNRGLCDQSGSQKNAAEEATARLPTITSEKTPEPLPCHVAYWPVP
jgi:hypothetical protein